MRYLLAALLLFAGPVYADLTDNLIAYYKCDESSGDLLDAHSNSYDLTLNSASVGTQTGVINGGRDYPFGKWHYIADNANLSGAGATTNITISCWVYMPNFGGERYIVGKWSTGPAKEYILTIPTDGKPKFSVSHDGTNTSNATFSGTAMSTSTWYHIVCGYDATADEIFIAVNDSTPDTTSQSTGVYDGAAAFGVGATDAGAPSGDFYHFGGVDEIGVWKRVLTSEEITSLYNSGSGLSYDSFGGGSTVPLIHYYQQNQGD